MTGSRRSPKIVLIGAGSAIFGPNTIATILRSERLRGGQLGLVDIDTGALDYTQAVAERMNRAWDSQFEISASTDHREVLEGADFVIVSVEVQPREELWRKDWQIPLDHGLRQPFGENGGPGGMMHAFRQIPPFMEIVRDMEAHCPQAWLINFSNPLPRLTRAASKYSNIRCVGKCHQIEVGYAIVGVLLSERYGLEVPEGIAMHSDPSNFGPKEQLANSARCHVSIEAAGLNHFTWMVDVRDRHSGEDLYPQLREARDEVPDDFEPLSMDLFRVFGYCPVPGDTHVAEYLPWTHDPLTKPWQKYGLRLYDWEGNETFREFSRHRLQAMADGSLAVEGMREAHSEGAAEIIEAIWGNLNCYEEAVNIPNRGAIPNLPPQTIVEVPATVSGDGLYALQMDPLPEPIAELCRREASLVELVVDAAVEGDRQLALQALLLDPMINDVDRARSILDDYLDTFSAALPQF